MTKAEHEIAFLKAIMFGISSYEVLFKYLDGLITKKYICNHVTKLKRALMSPRLVSK